MAARFEQTAIPEVIVVTPKLYKDTRGSFSEIYKRSEFKANGIPDRFIQDNYSYSVRGVLRGLHYQKHPKAQAKLVQIVRGEVFDVAVDIRKGSPTYGRWVGVKLSRKNRRLLYIPAGFAHGFCVLSSAAEMVYKVTEEYAPELDRGILWSDSEISVRWPIDAPIISDKDSALPSLSGSDNDFSYPGYSDR